MVLETLIVIGTVAGLSTSPSLNCCPRGFPAQASDSSHVARVAIRAFRKKSPSLQYRIASMTRTDSGYMVRVIPLEPVRRSRDGKTLEADLGGGGLALVKGDSVRILQRYK